MPRLRARLICAVLCGIGVWLSACRTAADADTRGDGTGRDTVLSWGGDAEGGAPFVEADAQDPSLVRGFDVELAELMAAHVGRKAQFVQVAWASIEQSVARGDVDVGLSGLEDRPALRTRYAVTDPYFEFREVLAVRPADTARYRSLADLRGQRVATLGNTLAYRLLLDAQRDYGVVPVSYDDNVHPYTDLLGGRVEAVLLDHVLAEQAERRTPGFVIQPGTVAIGHYVGVVAQGREALRDSLNVMLRLRMADGSLERIFRRWQVWDSAQAAFQARVLRDAKSTPGDAVAATEAVAAGPATSDADASDANASDANASDADASYLPALLRGAGLTVVISVAAMAVAVLLGIVVASGRVYGPSWMRAALVVYVEVVRGTPVLLQLFVLYYGLAGVVRLPALLAAILGLGLNYAAYEAEVYRAALQAIPRAQLEAARTLGLSEWQVFRLVRAPQALRLALAPMTNDFVALLKDSSLVSVITVVELTKQTAIYATNVGSWLVPGLLCAAMYLALSLPLARVARQLEARWRLP
ncbi:MAG: ABC transporter permease subunit [Gemmatimonadaceae bacterium]|nr:ABC transporter permease subunit [Gemmatimonadaceae bacterium]